MVKRRKIVAVVDDDPSMLNAAESLLDAQGFATMVFASAEEFLDRGAATQVDCLLLDIHLGAGCRVLNCGGGSRIPDPCFRSSS